MERRHFLTTSIVATAISFLFTAPESRAQAHTKGRPVAATSPTLKPGDYAWYRMPSIGAGVVVMKTQSSHRKIYCRATHASRRWPSCTSSQSLRITKNHRSGRTIIYTAGTSQTRPTLLISCSATLYCALWRMQNFSCGGSPLSSGRQMIRPVSNFSAVGVAN